MNKKVLILGIESSCDETAAAILENGKIKSNIIANQSIHEKYGGVVPELASRKHQQNIIPTIHQAIREANIHKNEISAIAYTQGPGLLGSLLVGSSFAKSLSLTLDIPLIDVNHIHAHILVHFIENNQLSKPIFPFIGVVLSGGHTQIIWVESYFEMKIIGTTLDDAIGEAFDKIGKKIGLGYPAGVKIDKLAKKGNATRFSFPIPKTPDLNVSYSGIKTAVINFLHKNTQQNSNFINENINDICASVQDTLIKISMKKIEKAVLEKNNNRVVIGGGVSANSKLREILLEKEKKEGWNVYIPPIEYTTDNAAMIAMVGYLKYKENKKSSITHSPYSRMS